MLTCDDATQLIRASDGGVLDAVDTEQLREHVDQCPGCRRCARTQRLVRELLVRRPEDALPAGFEARLAARLDAESGLDWCSASGSVPA